MFSGHTDNKNLTVYWYFYVYVTKRINFRRKRRIWETRPTTISRHRPEKPPDLLLHLSPFSVRFWAESGFQPNSMLSLGHLDFNRLLDGFTSGMFRQSWNRSRGSKLGLKERIGCVSNHQMTSWVDCLFGLIDIWHRRLWKGSYKSVIFKSQVWRQNWMTNMSNDLKVSK